MLRNVFTINLGRKIIPGRVTILKLGEDGSESCIAAATEADKIIVHSSTNRLGGDSVASNECSLLNINQTVNSLSAGPLKPESGTEYLVIGTPTSILVYDVENNTDLFYREIPDGANTVTVGPIGSIENSSPLAIAGGNCALQGFNWKGNDSYWTVTGDNITALALFDINGDGQNELLVGSEDYDIRIFAEDTIISEMTETDSIIHLCPIMTDTFAYALSNGTVGVYHRQERLWRIKSKNSSVALFAWDVNGDGIPELITGWTSGKVDGRNIETGEVVFKDNFESPIASILAADYNNDGIIELLVVSTNGEIRGYQCSSLQSLNELPVYDSKQEDELIRDLMKRKQLMLRELRNYEENERFADSQTTLNATFSPKLSVDDSSNPVVGSIPATTQVTSNLIICTESSTIKLNLTTSNSTIIRAVVIFAEGIFNGESFVVHPNDRDVSQSISVTLAPEKDLPIDLHAKVIVGYVNSLQYHVFELTRRLPKFSMYLLSNNRIGSGNSSNSYVRFNLNEKMPKLIQWLNLSFLIDEEHRFDMTDPLDITFYCLRDNSYLRLLFKQSEGEFIIYTHSIELAGELIQSLVVDFLNLDDLTSEAYFPKEIELMKNLIIKVEEIQAVRQRLASEIAETSSNIRTLVIRSEDSRLLNEYVNLRQSYTDLQTFTRELMNSYRIRQTNHTDLVSALKEINLSIQKSANLRVGKSKTQLITSCRTAIKKNNLHSLSKIITSGT